MPNIKAIASDSLRALVQKKLAEFLLAEFGELLHRLEIAHSVQRPFSQIYHLDAATDKRMHRFIVKIITENPLNNHATPAQQCLNEFSILNTLYPYFEAIKGCSVPKPAAIIPEADALITFFVEGHLLARDLHYVHHFSSRAKFRILRNHFYECGRWLRHLGKCAGIRPVSNPDVSHILAGCDQRLRLIEESQVHACPKEFRSKVNQYLRQLADSLSGVPIPVTGCHADYGPWNIIANEHGITVLDFFGYKDGLLPLSILSILVYLDTIGNGLANNSQRIHELKKSFMEGVGSIPPMPQAAVLLCETYHRVINLTGAITSESGHAFQKFENYLTSRKNIRWLESRPTISTLWPQDLTP